MTRGDKILLVLTLAALVGVTLLCSAATGLGTW